MLTLTCLFGLEIHLAIPRRDLDQKSRMIGSAEAHKDSVSSAQHAFIEHLLCARDWTRLYPQCARMKTIFTDELKLRIVWASSSVEEASSLVAALNQERIYGSTPSWAGRWQRETWGSITWHNHLHPLSKTAGTRTPAWFGKEAEPPGMSGGQAAASVHASRPQEAWGGPHSHVPFSCGSLCHQWSQCVCTSLSTSGGRTRPKPSAFPFPWENRLASYFSSLKIFPYHLNQGRQWTQGYRQGQRYKPTSHLGQTEKKFLQLWKYFTIISTCESKSYCFHNLSKILNES